MRSKGIRGVAYDAEARTLDVEFSSSRVYRYFDVPPSVYEWLVRVDSKGKFINRLVKDRYRYERIDGPSAADEESDLLESLRKSLEDPPDRD
ncbi:MAG TPA: KTSC domain-containing protein [Gammaproteobacteria bacterium]